MRTFNCKKKMKTITFADVWDTINSKSSSESDCLAAPYRVFIRNFTYEHSNSLFCRGFICGAGSRLLRFIMPFSAL